MRSETQGGTAELERLFGPDPDFEVRLDGATLLRPRQRARFAVVFHDAALLASLAAAPDLFRLADAFVAGAVDIEGDLVAAMSLVARIAAREGRVELPAARHSPEADARAVRYHYDVGNDFYRLVLDPRLVYSCAYFARPDLTLAEAQEQKLDIICKKLALRRGERLLDVGCGWGGLITFAAARYGVRAHGITLSPPQAEGARAAARAAGVGDRVVVDVCDYRTLPGDARYDKIVSVGMAEHVGPRGMGEYFAVVHERLADDGLFLHHAITDPDPTAFDGATRWFRTRIFPNSELDTVGHTLSTAEEAGFRVLHCATWAPHYAETLRRWLANLVAHEAEATALVGHETVRAYLLYFAGCAAAFDAGRVAIHQALLARRGSTQATLPARAELAF